MFSRLPPKSNPEHRRSPSNGKEGLDGVPANKRCKITAGVMVSNGEGSQAGFEVNSREDVERLLNEKTKGKKMDYKGKSERMFEYIRKLKICIKWYMEREDKSLIEQEKLRLMLESEEKRRAEIEAQMKSAVEELNATNKLLRRHNASLEESLRKEEADKMAMIKSYEEEKLARLDAENSGKLLSEDLQKAGVEAKRLDDQIKMHQNNNKRLQEYNNSLQQYNSSLQSDVVKNGVTISKLQNEKNAMMESLNMARENQISLKNQLDAAKTQRPTSQ